MCQCRTIKVYDYISLVGFFKRHAYYWYVYCEIDIVFATLQRAILSNFLFSFFNAIG